MAHISGMFGGDIGEAMGKNKPRAYLTGWHSPFSSARRARRLWEDWARVSRLVDCRGAVDEACLGTYEVLERKDDRMAVRGIKRLDSMADVIEQGGG